MVGLCEGLCEQVMERLCEQVRFIFMKLNCVLVLFIFSIYSIQENLWLYNTNCASVFLYYYIGALCFQNLNMTKELSLERVFSDTLSMMIFCHNSKSLVRSTFTYVMQVCCEFRFTGFTLIQLVYNDLHKRYTLLCYIW